LTIKVQPSERKLTQKPIFRPFQIRWAKDNSRLALAVKSTQIGYSTATAAWAVFQRCLERPQHAVIFLSRSERQSLELARKAKGLVDAYQGIAAHLAENRQFQLTEQRQHEISFGNGSRIIVLAANPDTARGYTGDIVLDEFAFHQDSAEIFKAAYGRMTTPGLCLRVLSTPNGAQGRFFELAQRLGLDTGIRPRHQPSRRTDSGWSGHWCDVHLAVEEDFPISIARVRADCDEDTWLQEYCCNFLAGGSQWIPWELYEMNCDPTITVEEEPRGEGFYAGWDVARSRDLSVVWFSQLVGDVTHTRGILAMKGVPTPDQTTRVAAIMPRVHRLCIDKTGMGLPIFETMERLFPGKVEGISFTQATKQTMATTAKRRMEERRCRLPNDPAVWHSFRSVRKIATALGQVRFDADHDEHFGHADHWWAFCLAEAAADKPPKVLGVIEWLKQEQTHMLEAAKSAQSGHGVGPCPECGSIAVVKLSGRWRCNQCAATWGASSVAPLLPARRDLLAR
jgi:phage FluMu gp28-like protein